MWWSEGQKSSKSVPELTPSAIAMRPDASHKAAIAMAGAVLRAKGSSTKSPKQWASFKASASKKRWSSAANKTICGEKRFKRSSVRLNKLCPSIKGTNCLGKLCRLKGQSLVPEPPHKITGVMVGLALELSSG